MRNNDEFPTKKDLAYWLIILIMFIVGSFTVYYGSDKDMVSHIGFGGTIVSILLAVIAIIYSFYQSSTYESTTYKLDTSAQKIEKATKQLSDVSEIKVVLQSFKGEVKEINESISHLKEISGNIGSSVSSMRESFEDTKKNLLNSVNSSSQVMNVDEAGLNYEFFEKFLKSPADFLLFVVVLLHKAKKNNINKVNITKTVEYFINKTVEQKHNEENTLIMKNNFFYLQIGLLIAFKNLGLMDVVYVEGICLEIRGVNENLSLAIEDKIASLKDGENKNIYKLLIEIDSYLKDGRFS